MQSLAQSAFIKASNAEQNDYFGLSVAISGDTLVVGAPFEDSAATGVNGDQSNELGRDAGAAYVFVKSGGTWVQQAYLKASNSDIHDEFGQSVAIDGDRIVVGAPEESSSATGVDGDETDNSILSAGAAYVFERTGTVWSQVAYLKASNPEFDDKFGCSVAVTGDTVVVGARLEDSDADGINGDESNNDALRSGAAYVFRLTSGVWSQEAYLKASNSGGQDFFARSLAASGDTIVVGANGERNSAQGINVPPGTYDANNSGAAYVFVRTGAVWNQEAHIKSSNSEYGDAFGWGIAIDDDLLAVCARGEESAATGVDGDALDNSASSSGAAYIYSRTGSVWTEVAYLKASNTDSADGFGQAVAVLGERVVVGSKDDSGSSGVHANQDDNSQSSAGAAYVFERDAGIWEQVAFVKALVPDSSDYFGGALALSAESIIIAAAGDRSEGAGIDPEPFSETAYWSGAVYVFGGGALGAPYCPLTTNSAGAGASISLQGSASVAANNAVLSISGAPLNQPGLFFYGIQQVQVAFGNGHRCVGGAVVRLGPPVVSDGAGDVSRIVDNMESVIASSALPLLSGETRNFQYWFRDPSGGPIGLNLSNALSITFRP